MATNPHVTVVETDEGYALQSDSSLAYVGRAANQETAERLALCWNTHDDLMAALTALVMPGAGWYDRELARAALAAAKGGE